MAEPFDISVWKARIAAWWREASVDLPGSMTRLGMQTAYGMLAASALLPVVVAHASNPDPATAALAIVLSNVGANLVANLAQKDYDEANAARKAEQEINEHPALRAEYQQMLAALNVLATAQQALGERWSGFESQLRQELAQIGGGVRVDARGSSSVFWNVSAAGDVAGHDQLTGGDRAAVGAFERSFVWTGDLNLVLQKPSALELEQLLATIMNAILKGQANVQAHQGYRRTTVAAAGSPTVILSEQTADGLAQAAAIRGDELAYLSALRVHPRYGPWSTQFVPLAGWLTTPPEAHPEFRLLEGTREGGQLQIRRIPLQDLAEALRRYPAIVLLGKPGAGKTTQLYKLALDAARQWCETRAGKIPLFVPLAEYRGYASPQAMVEDLWRRYVGTASLNERLRHGQLMLLCDSLNEMPAHDEEDYKQRAQTWRRFVEAWPGNQVVFACRRLDYSAPLGLPEVEILDLDDARMQEFLHNYVPEQAAWVWDRLQKDPLLELVRTPYHLAMLAHVISCDQQWPANRAALFDRFVSCLLDREKGRGHRRWIDERAQRKALRQLAETMQPMGEGTRLPVGEALKRLPLRVDLSGVTFETPPQDILDLALAATLLDKEGLGSEHEQVRFYHHQLQEFFAAEALWERWKHGEDMSQRWFQPRSVAEMPDPGPLGPFEPLPAPPATRWEEPTILAAGLADDPAKFVTAVQGVNPVLAARCLTEAGIARETAVVEAAQEALLQEISNPQVHVRARIAAGETLGQLDDPRFREITVSGRRVRLPPLVRVTAASVQIGSTRWQAALLRLRGFTLAHDEVPRHTVRLPEFYVGMYPVTNAEFACFVDAGGYRDKRHWRTESARAWLRGETGESEVVKKLMQTWRDLKQDPSRLRRFAPTERDAAAWKQLLQMEETEAQTLLTKSYTERPRDRPAYADDERFNNPSQPVVGVTWFEACAFCNWLDEQIRAADTPLDALGIPLLDEDQVVRLPTEAEWETAARAPPAWVYPWGNRWNPNRANTYEGHVLRTTPVGIYSQGTTLAGAHDLSGNVWEWMQSLYKPYPTRSKDGRNEPSASGSRVLRGGSWSDSQGDARCAFRYWSIPVSWRDGVGFRVVFSLANPEF